MEYLATAQAMQNRIEKYEGVYLVPPAHILDELAGEFGFSPQRAALILRLRHGSLENLICPLLGVDELRLNLFL